MSEGEPALAVAAVVVRRDGRTLLVRRAPGRLAAGYWTPVTGRVEPGESLAAAAAREALEETGLRVLGGPEVFRCQTEGAPFLLVWLSCRLSEEERADALLLSDEVAEARWVGRGEALGLAPMFEVTRRYYEAVHPWGSTLG